MRSQKTSYTNKIHESHKPKQIKRRNFKIVLALYNQSWWKFENYEIVKCDLVMQ